MSELYNKIAALCEDRGITITELCRWYDIHCASLSNLKTAQKYSISIEGYYTI